MKRVVVTGGAGFIGSHLVKLLAERGYQVIILDDLSTGKMVNVESILGKVNVEFIQGSITDLPLVKQLFRGVHYVFHQAAISSVPRSVENPQSCHEANVTGTLNVLLAARDAGISKVIYASSSSVYGDTPILPKVGAVTEIGSGQSVQMRKVDKSVALNLLYHLKEEFPELLDLNEWAELTGDRITLDLMERLRLKAYRGDFKGKCKDCSG